VTVPSCFRTGCPQFAGTRGGERARSSPTFVIFWNRPPCRFLQEPQAFRRTFPTAKARLPFCTTNAPRFRPGARPRIHRCGEAHRVADRLGSRIPEHGERSNARASAIKYVRPVFQNGRTPSRRTERRGPWGCSTTIGADFLNFRFRRAPSHTSGRRNQFERLAPDLWVLQWRPPSNCRERPKGRLCVNSKKRSASPSERNGGMRARDRLIRGLGLGSLGFELRTRTSKAEGSLVRAFTARSAGFADTVAES